MKKRLGALLCALVMCLALLSPASALEEVCFTSLNNKLLPLASDTMPLGSGGVLYVPASLFDGSATNASYGVTLGVSLTQSQSSGRGCRRDIPSLRPHWGTESPGRGRGRS